VVGGSEPSSLPKPSLMTYEGMLIGSSSTDQTPIIGIIANYDTFTLAPALSFGADFGGSGAVSLLELARLFAKLYNNPRTQGKYSLVFILTGGNALNYAGTRDWLSTADSRLLEKLEFVLCLDGLGDGKGLNMHVSKQPKDDVLYQLYQDFVQTAAQMNIPFEIVHKKVNISNPDVDWEHEHFSLKRIAAGTLSHYHSPRESFVKSDIFDVRSKINDTALIRNIQFIAESLAKHIFGSNGDVFEGNLQVNDHFVKSWLDTLAASPRSSTHQLMSPPLLHGIHSTIQQYISTAHNRSFTPDSDYIFFDRVTATLYIYKVKPLFFDLLFSVIVITYLFFVYTIIKGPLEVYHQIANMFVKDKKKKKN